MTDCADGFIIAIRKLAEYQPEPIKSRLFEMGNHIEENKICVLLGNLDCVINALEVFGVEAFEILAELAKDPSLRDLFLRLRSIDIEVLQQLWKLHKGNLLDFLKLIRVMCDLLTRKAAIVNAYLASLGAKH